MRLILACAILILSSTIHRAQGQNFNSTFVEYAYGWNNMDYATGTNPVNEQMQLVTFDHTTATSWGGVYMFVNYMISPSGFYETGYNNQTVDPTSGTSRLYSEISPWINITNLFYKEGESNFLSQISLEGQLNIGHGYKAGLVGLGTTFKTGQNTFLKAMAYWRTDNIKEDAMQITGVFDIPLLKKERIRLQGFFDLIPSAKNKAAYGGTDLKTDFISQARILWDVNSLNLFKDNYTKMELGVDFYMHFNADLKKNNAAMVVPQPCIRVTI